MQMNIYVPKEKETVVAELERTAARTGRPKNDLVLEALERYLADTKRSIELESFSLGDVQPVSRKELYRGSKGT